MIISTPYPMKSPHIPFITSTQLCVLSFNSPQSPVTVAHIHTCMRHLLEHGMPNSEHSLTIE